MLTLQRILDFLLSHAAELLGAAAVLVGGLFTVLHRTRRALPKLMWRLPSGATEADQLTLDLKYLAEVIPPKAAEFKPDRGYTPVQILFGTDRAPLHNGESGWYGSTRGEGMRYGVAEVSIPLRHRPGHLERPGLLRVILPEDPQKHVAVVAVQELDLDAWVTTLRLSLPTSTRAVLVFIHGYNVTFAEAARRTAQLSYDLAFDGIPILFSWPSSGSIAGYMADEATIEWATAHLQQLLSVISDRAGVSEINAIAHSMGNRALAEAVCRFADSRSSIRLNQVVLAAPDIDAKLFTDYIAPRLAALSRQCSLYASSGDAALALSQTVHAFPRAGQGEPDLVVAPALDTIDASPVDMDLLGHGYFAENKQVIDDIFMVVRHDLPPPSRNLRSRRKGQVTYWVMP